MRAASSRNRMIVLWRHGQTAWNREQRFQGTTDVELSAVGVEEARRAARRLAVLAPDAIITSDLKRAAATAEQLSSVTGLPVTAEESLREAFTGRWQGLTQDQIVARYGDEYAAWKRGEPVRRGGGELDTELAARAVPTVERHAGKLPDGGTLVVASHGGTIRACAGRLLGLAPEDWISLAGLSNCHWHVLSEEPSGWRLSVRNAGAPQETEFSEG
ncbi:phosphoglycerate mutase [Streptomyces sp. 150FB]|uniref:histidine phosphatase family protein n=1 Tax=Streptomyces sp. 150FB TaxID=1576605 RepID=UPI00058919AF|nr:histidine phosphatase family protein [Streptomyces sp. 150FB]KIF78042.1 phosphoglycerate mutase [Streptomyces sp. 150FB]